MVLKPLRFEDPFFRCSADLSLVKTSFGRVSALGIAAAWQGVPDEQLYDEPTAMWASTNGTATS